MLQKILLEMTLRQPLNSLASKFGVDESCNDIMETVSKMSTIFLIKVGVCDSER
jgi:hypothetical protein